MFAARLAKSWDALVLPERARSGSAALDLGGDPWREPAPSATSFWSWTTSGRGIGSHAKG